MSMIFKKYAADFHSLLFHFVVTYELVSKSYSVLSVYSVMGIEIYSLPLEIRIKCVPYHNKSYSVLRVYLVMGVEIYYLPLEIGIKCGF